MSWYSGTIANTAGSIKAVLDTDLVLNSNWHIEDASAGTNIGVYHNYDAANNVDYIVVARDDQADYCTVELWEGWDSGTHTGTGVGLTVAGSYTFRIRKAEAGYGLSVFDHRFVWCHTGSFYMYYIGMPTRFDATKNTPILIVHTSYGGTTYSYNPCGHVDAYSSGLAWRGLLDTNRTAGPIIYPLGMSASAMQISWITSTGDYYLLEHPVYQSTTNHLIGLLTGVAYGGYYMSGLANGDMITIAGTTWYVCGAGTRLSAVSMA